jgi:RNA polymerase sigma-70 factor (ECF subfamily)
MELRALPLWMTRGGPEDEREAEFTLILQRAIAGDVSAFEQVIARYERRVLTLAWRLLGSFEDAQDASQEVFLRTFRFLHRFDKGRPFEPWFVRITVNVCRDLRRKRQRQPDSLIDADALKSSSNPDADLHSQQQRQMLYRALQELPEKERAAVVLRDIEGLSTAEVAEILGSSEATVRSQISNARLKIKRAVKRGRT